MDRARVALRQAFQFVVSLRHSLLPQRSPFRVFFREVANRFFPAASPLSVSFMMRQHAGQKIYKKFLAPGMAFAILAVPCAFGSEGTKLAGRQLNRETRAGFMVRCSKSVTDLG